MSYCQACGKELPDDARYCAECAEALSIYNVQTPAYTQPDPNAQPQQPQPPMGASMNNGYNEYLQKAKKRGHGPAIAAFVLAIIAFLGTVAIAALLALVKPQMEISLKQVIDEELVGITLAPEEMELFLASFSMGMKISFTMMHFLSAAPMIATFICGLVAVVKYHGNKTEGKLQSTAVFAYIALGLLLLSLIIAIAGSSSYAGLTDRILAPYYV